MVILCSDDEFDICDNNMIFLCCHTWRKTKLAAQLCDV
jgi:hypothetical protein